MSDIKRGRRPLSPHSLLFTRRHTSEVLDASIDKVKELENLGLLDKVQLTGPRGAVHHRAAQVLALAAAENSDATTAPASTVPFRRSSK